MNSVRNCNCGGRPLYCATPIGCAISCSKCDIEVYGGSMTDVAIKWDALQKSECEGKA